MSIATSNIQWRYRIAFTLLVLSLCLRVPVTIGWIQNIECSKYAVECFLPFLLTFNDFCGWSDSELRRKKVDDSLVHDAPTKTARWPKNGRYRYIFATLVFSVTANIALAKSSPPASTYICLPSNKGPLFAVTFQVLGLLLDAVAINCAQELSTVKTSNGPTLRRVQPLASAILVSSVFLAILLGLIQLAHPTWTQWMVGISVTSVVTIVKLALVIATAVVCVMALSSKLGLQQCMMLACFFTVWASIWLSAWTLPLAMALTSEDTHLLNSYLGVMTVAFTFAAGNWSSTGPFASSEVKSARPGKRTLGAFTGVGAFLLFSQLLFSFLRVKTLHSHPIDALIVNAGKRYADWQKDMQFGTFTTALTNYRARYGRSPPPNFDKWYDFAVSRDSLIFDDFDNIYNDLLPFWSIAPSRLRQMTTEDIVQVENGIGGISIRNHNAIIDPGVPQSHEWMMEAVINMTAPFIKWLPDMNLPFNMNDESRVVLSYDAQKIAIRHASSATNSGPKEQVRNSFNYSGATNWLALDHPPEDYHESHQQFQPIFESHGSLHCPPASPARNRRSWQLQHVCSSCVYTHSHPMGSFPLNVSLARDICDQPDSAYLHGFYSAPSTFKPTTEMRPTFSQSKAPGFLDIRYPNPWNYADMAPYAPIEIFPDLDFSEKQNMLFWRGTTTEGFASADGHHAWHGMTRQRFVNAMSFPNPQNVLLPVLDRDSSSSTTMPNVWRYKHLSENEVGSLLSSNVSIAAPIARCMHTDCSDQIDLFNRTSAVDASPNVVSGVSTTSIDFQENWRYRYLFDMDGAGFSGRFLPFLRSKSLVVKTTGLFSEWWEGRILEWWHYVPVDSRLTGLYSTLTYFMGVKLGNHRNGMKWEGRQDQAELIASNGREWANKVLRKEDMEIYMFRLLLEWGRLVDEDRDEIGFVSGA